MDFLLEILLSTAMAAPVNAGNCDLKAMAYVYKAGCVVDGDPAQCLMSVGSASLGTGIAVGSASYAAAALKGLAGDARFVKGFEKNLARLAELNSLERTKERVRQAANAPVSSAKSSDRKMIELAKEFLDETPTETPKTIKEFRETFIKDGTFDERLKAVDDKIRVERSKIFKDIFPDDPQFKKIYASYEDMIKKETAALEEKDFTKEKNRWYADLKKAQEGKTPDEQAKIRQKMMPEYEKIEAQEQANDKALTEVRKSVAEKFMGKNPKMAVLLRIQELSKSDFHIGKAALAMQDAKPSFDKRRGDGVKATKVGIAGVGFATAVSLGLYTRGQFDIRACQKTLGLSDEEIKFLSNDQWLAPAKAARQGYDCDSLVLENPQKTIEEAMRKYGSVPPGLCNIIRLGDEKLDNLIGEQSIAPVISCDNYKDTNVQVSSDKVFQYNDGSRVYKAPYSEELLYPDFRFVKIYDQSGNEDKKASLEMQGQYSRIHPANVPNPRPDTDDLATVCRTGDRGFSCPLVRGAVRARIAKTVSNLACGKDVDGSSPKSAPASGQTSEQQDAAK
ncbi:MAG: hypothetical protein JSU04_10605 [Bdellovibrionales bacterium]|nr:hypothetical protein [Bdellovibrionales bacterium]